jgi:acetoacetyl-CoA synthetase
MIGDTLWTPPADVRRVTEIGRYLDWLGSQRGQILGNYAELWRWSVDDLDAFWSSVWDFYGVGARPPGERVLERGAMPGAEWFPGVRLNYAEHLLGTEHDLDQVAVLARSQTRPDLELTFRDLREQAARARHGLQRLGVGPGDRVVAYAPNIPETLVAFIATASLGAIWATCAPEFGARAVIDRFSQIEPKVLLTVGGYGYRDRYIDRRGEVRAIREALPTLERMVWVPYGTALVDDALAWEDLLDTPAPLEFERVPFDHPLYVLFSSGTTGVPKAIVHGHGGQLLEHHKNQGLVRDLKPGGRLLWFTTTSWMMWNSLISALLMRASIVMLDGDPTWPDLLEQWRVAEQLRPSVMGMAPSYLTACRKAGICPGRQCDLRSIHALCTTGSPLPAAGYRYVYEQLPEVLLINGAGSTDVATAIVSGSFLQPVYEGEISGPCLAVDACALDPDGRPIIGEFGELVIRKPMPSMPVGLWNDPSGSRYRASYFERYPGVWHQADWTRFTERGSCVVAGRSDATLNRGGVRLGTGEFYAIVEAFPEIVESLVIHVEDPDGGGGELLLFVAAEEGAVIDETLQRRITEALRTQLSPRHVPDAILAVAAVPRTTTGKKLEVAVKRALQGEPISALTGEVSIANRDAWDALLAIATTEGRDPRRRRGG